MKSDLLSRIGALAASSVLLSILSACAGPEVVPREVAPPPVTSVAEADQQLAAVKRERAGIEARYAERERVCYTKFLVNNCLNEAKEQRRSALSAQHAIEIQAARFKRQALVEARDREMAAAEKRFQEEEAELAAEPPKPAPAAAPLKPLRKPVAPGRAAERDARQRAAQQHEAADAEKRAANVRAFERRKAESEARQRRVAERQAERAAKAAKRAEDAKARAAQDAERAKAAVQGQ